MSDKKNVIIMFVQICECKCLTTDFIAAAHNNNMVKISLSAVIPSQYITSET